MTDAERIKAAIEALEVVEKYRPLTPEDTAIADALAILRGNRSTAAPPVEG